VHVSVTNLHNIICFYATIYLVEQNKPMFNHLFISNDDVTPEMWKSVMIYLHNTAWKSTRLLKRISYKRRYKTQKKIDEIGNVDVVKTAKKKWPIRKVVECISIYTCSYNFFNNDMYMQFHLHINNKFVGETCILYHTNILIHPGPGYAGIF